MKIIDYFKKERPVLAFEIFPPKKTATFDNIEEVLDKLKLLSPDYISVTFGAGGSAAGRSTSDIAKMIQEKYEIEPLVHLSCINYTKDEIAIMLNKLRENGTNNILALRGDINPDVPRKEDFTYASDLVAFIKQYGNFNVSGACYPEGHGDSKSLAEDILNLKKKVDAGAEHLVSQLFFDNEAFYSFRERAEIAGIHVPIEAGIMPVVNKKQIERMVSLCGASLPAKFSKIMQKYENNPEALRDAGIAYAVDQIVDLLAHDVDGIHLYTMNNPAIAEKICNAIKNLI